MSRAQRSNDRPVAWRILDEYVWSVPLEIDIWAASDERSLALAAMTKVSTSA
jgi:hypothetical protein